MKIDKVTISGPDDNVDPGELCILQDRYPFVEWGILVSHKRMGERRYPTANWIKKLPYKMKVSLHLCGQVCREFVDRPGEDIVYDINGEHWDRIQLNVAFKDAKDYSAKLYNIAEFAYRNSEKAVIIPYNKVNKRVVDSWLGMGEIPENIHFLYDSSGGRGRVITSFSKPMLNYTGYAGGITPDYVSLVCETLAQMEWPDNIWIDMESGVRTDEVFDIGKVKQVLSACEKFVTN